MAVPSMLVAYTKPSNREVFRQPRGKPMVRNDPHGRGSVELLSLVASSPQQGSVAAVR
jgi:hypothetical protein